MKSYTDLNKVILDKLTTLQIGGEVVFNDVYTSSEAKPTGYPCAYVLDSSGDGEGIDTARNEREWQFEINLKQEISRSGKDPETAAILMRKIVDAVIEMFDQDPQLTVSSVSQCMRARVVPVMFDYTIQAEPFIFAKFILSVVDLVNNYP